MHRNAPVSPEGRLRLCQRIEDGWTVAAAAESMNISRQCAHKWWRRYPVLASPRHGGLDSTTGAFAGLAGRAIAAGEVLRRRPRARRRGRARPTNASRWCRLGLWPTGGPTDR